MSLASTLRGRVNNDIAGDPPMTRTAWVGRRIAFLRQAFGVTITVRLGELDLGTRPSYRVRLA